MCGRNLLSVMQKSNLKKQSFFSVSCLPLVDRVFCFKVFLLVHPPHFSRFSYGRNIDRFAYALHRPRGSRQEAGLSPDCFRGGIHRPGCPVVSKPGKIAGADSRPECEVYIKTVHRCFCGYEHLR